MTEPTMQETQYRERELKGWSRWDIAALGADTTLIPRIGAAVASCEQLDPETRDFGRYIRDNKGGLDWLNDHLGYEDYKLEYEYNKWSIQHNIQLNKAYDSFVANAEIVYHLKDSNGFNPMKSLGEAMIWFADSPPHGSPHNYDGIENFDESYNAWVSDLKKYGTMLSNLEIDNAREVWEWMKIWSGHLWD